MYLDKAALEGYIAAAEGGLRKGGTASAKRGRGGRAGVKASVLEVSADRNSSRDETQSFDDHESARLERLIEAIEADDDTDSWLRVMDPEGEFPTVQPGTMLLWRCDIEVPPMIRALTPAGGLGAMLDMMDAIAPSAGALGLSTAGMPSPEAIRAMRQFTSGTKVKTTVIASDEVETDWRAMATLDDSYMIPGVDIEGRAELIAKVVKTVETGRYEPIPAMPGMEIMSRQERRRISREGPPDNVRDLYVEGPVLVLDVLAISR
jgi:hypothetical protein